MHTQSWKEIFTLHSELIYIVSESRNNPLHERERERESSHESRPLTRAQEFFSHRYIYIYTTINIYTILHSHVYFTLITTNMHQSKREKTIRAIVLFSKCIVHYTTTVYTIRGCLYMYVNVNLPPRKKKSISP